MSVQYVSDSEGKTTAILIPINDWIEIKEKYNVVEDALNEDNNIPQWKKDFIDGRSNFIYNNYDKLLSEDDFFKALAEGNEKI